MARGTWGGSTDRHPFKVDIKWTTGTNVAQTGFHMRATGAEIGTAGEIATEVADFVTDSFRTILNTGNRIVGVDVVDLVTREGASNSPVAQFGTAAVAVVNLLPSFMAFTVSMKGELRTRYGQGRMFWPIGGDGSVDGDLLAAAALPGIQGVIDEMTNRFVGGSFAGYRLINVHGVLEPRAATPSRPARPAVPASWYDVVSLRLNQNVTALRSRKAGVGS